MRPENTFSASIAGETKSKTDRMLAIKSKQQQSASMFQGMEGVIRGDGKIIHSPYLPLQDLNKPDFSGIARWTDCDHTTLCSPAQAEPTA